MPLIDSVVSLAQRFFQRVGLAGDAHLGNVEDLALSRFQELVGGHDLIVGIAQDLGAGVNQMANDRLLADPAAWCLLSTSRSMIWRAYFFSCSLTTKTLTSDSISWPRLSFTP